MKVIKRKEESVERADGRIYDGSWSAVRDQFVTLEEADLLKKLGGSVLVCNSTMRPFLSRTAKMEGFTYFTIGLRGTDKMLVIKHRPFKKLKVKLA